MVDQMNDLVEDEGLNESMNRINEWMDKVISICSKKALSDGCTCTSPVS